MSYCHKKVIFSYIPGGRLTICEIYKCGLKEIHYADINLRNSVCEKFTASHQFLKY